MEYHIDMPAEHLPSVHVDVASNDVDFIIRWLLVYAHDGSLSLYFEVALITKLYEMLFNMRSKAGIHTPFNGPLSGTTRVSRYQKGKTNLDFTEARDSEWHWHQLGHMQVCISLQTDNHASTPPLTFFTGRMPFLPPNQQYQSTEGKLKSWHKSA